MPYSCRRSKKFINLVRIVILTFVSKSSKLAPKGVYKGVYGLEYERATVTKKSGKKNLHACVTIPLALRPLLKNRTQIYKTLGTTDQREAYELLSDKEAEIWRELDQANLASHPLAVAYTELVLSLIHI